MSSRCTFIGFGEAGQAFASPGIRVFDLKSSHPESRPALLSACSKTGAILFETAEEALSGADLILSLVTADQAEAAARAYARFLEPGALWLDMNSVAPKTKSEAEEAIRSASALYVDVAVMAPVDPAGKKVPLLVSGPEGEQAMSRLGGLGFTRVESAGPRIGDASAIKMIRSVMVKGIEALTAECLLAAHRAGVVDPVLQSLDSSASQESWRARANYNLGRMLVHGERRAAEMDEVARTLEQIGIEPLMTRSAAKRHRAIGRVGADPGTRLEERLEAIDPMNEEPRA